MKLVVLPKRRASMEIGTEMSLSSEKTSAQATQGTCPGQPADMGSCRLEGAASLSAEDVGERETSKKSRDRVRQAKPWSQATDP